VVKALEERWCGFPTLAPYFHFAFGWGIAVAMQFSGFPSSIIGTFPCVIFGPALHLLWYQLVDLVKHVFGANTYCAAPCIMGLAITAALTCGDLKYPAQADFLLFMIAILNQGYFMHHALVGRGIEVNPPEL